MICSNQTRFFGVALYNCVTLNDLKNEYWQQYFTNGSIMSKYNYINDLMNGYCKRYNNKGLIIKIAYSL